MFSHIVLGSNDIERSKRFYDATIGALGGPSAFIDDNGRLIYMHNGLSLLITKPMPMVVRSASPFKIQRRPMRGMRQGWSMAACPLRMLRACAKGRWEPSILPISVIRTVTSFARCTSFRSKFINPWLRRDAAGFRLLLCRKEAVRLQAVAPLFLPWDNGGGSDCIDKLMERCP